MPVRAYIGAFKRALSEHDLTPLEDALANFRRDRTPEREIQVWERIARSYSAELSVRPQASERHLLYRVIFARSLAADIGLFVLALSIEGRTELDSIRAVLRCR